jgi:hypothetical protein
LNKINEDGRDIVRAVSGRIYPCDLKKFANENLDHFVTGGSSGL